MQESNWMQLKGDKIKIQELLHLENKFPENSIEYIALAFSKKWINRTEIFTQQSSGSTGVPKLHKVKRDQMQASAVATVTSLKLNKGDTALLSISPDYIGGKMMIVRAIEHHLNLLIGEVSSDPLNNLDQGQSIDFFSFVPYQLSKILEKPNEHTIKLLNKAKAIILGGAPVSESLELTIKKLISAPVFSTYGMTETVSHVALKRINGETNSHFKALEGIRFSVDNRNCLVIHAPAITGKPKLITNDVVALIDENQFDWLGRYDFVINSGGIKLQPEQIELKIEKLMRNAGFQNQFFVFGLPHEQLGNQLCLIVENKINKDRLNEIMRKELKPYELPKLIFVTDSFSKTKNDKLDRKATLLKAGIISG